MNGDRQLIEDLNTAILSALEEAKDENKRDYEAKLLNWIFDKVMVNFEKEPREVFIKKTAAREGFTVLTRSIKALYKEAAVHAADPIITRSDFEAALKILFCKVYPIC